MEMNEQAEAVLLVEDDPLVAQSLVNLLRPESIVVVATSSEAIAALDERSWIAAIVDIGLRDGRQAGLDVIAHAHAVHPQLRLLAMTGLLGFDKEESDRIARTCAIAGALVFPKPIDAKVFKDFLARAKERRKGVAEIAAARFKLSPREASLLAWVEKGGSTAEYAAREGIQESTAKTHVSSLLRRAGARTLDELLIRLLQERRSNS